MVPAATWPKLVAARGLLAEAAAASHGSLVEVVAGALATRDLMPARILTGTANVYLREMGEAEDAAEQAVDLFVAKAAVAVVAQAPVPAGVLALSHDPAADADTRERAGFLYPLIASTDATVRVAEARLLQLLGAR